MLAQERRNLILAKLQEEKKVIVSELSHFFGVSEETIRRDLDILEKDGFVTKSYGGAIINENLSIDLPFNVRKKRNIAGKQKIAQIVDKLIESGDSIMLDASTTAVFIAKAIKSKKNLTVITNSLEIMIELSDMHGWKVITPGGTLREGYLALVGSQATEGLRNYHVNKAFVSCKGIDLEHGMTDGDEDFAKAKHVMLHNAKEKVLVFDSSKFGKVAFAEFGNISEVDIVVTDSQPDKKWLDFFEKNSICCYYP